MASPLGNRKNSKFMAVSTAPSINKTPMGASTPPVPYPVCHDLSNSVGIVPHVKLNSDPAYVLDQTIQSRCTGDEPGTAGGIRSGTVNGEVKPTSASGHVKITKKYVVRVGDTCTLNAGNCPGVYVAGPALSAPGASANPPIVPETPAEKAFLEKLGLWWEETKTQLGQAAAHPVEATKGAVKDTLNIIPQLAQLLMQGSALRSAGEMEQAAALQSAFGNSQTASQLHTTAEGVRQSADQIHLPQFEMSNPAQEGGAKIATAAQLATGVAGLAKGGVKLGARGMAKIGIKPAGALEKAAVKIGKTGDGFHVKGRGPASEGSLTRLLGDTKVRNVSSKRAEDVNEWWRKEKGYLNDPYKPGTEAFEFELAEPTTLTRVYDDVNSFQKGGWLMKKEDIAGLTPQQIRDKYALPQAPKYVTDVKLPAGAKLRIGKANRIPGWGDGGGAQLDMLGQRGIGEQWLAPRPIE